MTMASRKKGDDDNEPQEDDELTSSDQYEMDMKMNEAGAAASSTATNHNGHKSGSESGGGGGIGGKHSHSSSKMLRPDEIRERYLLAKSALLTNRHYQFIAVLILVIIFLAIMLLFVSSKLLAITLHQEEPICESSDCLSTSARLLSNMQPLAYDETYQQQYRPEPCEDFYKFSCGGWLQTNQLTDNQAHHSVMEQIENKIYDELRRYLDQVLPTGPANDAHFKLKRFYESCQDLQDIDVVSLKYFQHEIQKVGGWNVMGNWYSHAWDQAQVVQRLQTTYGVDAFFHLQIGPDDLDPKLPFIIKIYPSGLGLPNKNYYFDPKYKQIVDAYKQYMSETVKIFGGTKLDASQFAENTFNYEKRIAEITPDQTEYLIPSNVFKRRHSIRELQTLAPSIKWSNIVQNYFAKARLGENTRVLLAFEPYFRNISNIISTTDNQGLNDYLIWRMIFTYAPYLSKDFRIIHKNYLQSLYGLPVTNQLNDEQRWRFCLETASKFMGNALSSLYVTNRINEISNITELVKIELVNSIRNTVLRNTNLFLWTQNNRDDIALQLINMKLNQMEILIGHPNFVIKNNVADYYNEFIVGVKFLENILESIDHQHKKMEMMLNERRTDYAWPVLAHSVQARYEYASNKMYLPAGYLQPPIFNARELPVMQYGSLGFHLASHMLNAFDLTGLFYGLPEGRLSSNFTFVNRLNNGLQCLRQELSSLPFDVELVLSQSYVDIGALKVAWLAYQEFSAKQINQLKRLPSMSFTDQQLFFISFAQSMCSNTKQNAMELLMEKDHHLPSSIRINAIVAQSAQFIEAFNCPEKQSMLRRQCHLWN